MNAANDIRSVLRRGSLRIALALLVLWAAAPAHAASEYLRVTTDDAGTPVSMQTAVTRLVNGSGVEVDLVGVTHLAQEQYYMGINRMLADYDAVLYEMVLAQAPGPGQRLVIDKEKLEEHPLSATQVALAEMLGLDFQLFFIDYSGDNFVHADLTTEQFQQAMGARNESPMSLLMKIFQTGENTTVPVNQAEMAELDLASLMLRGPNPREQRILRRFFAQGFASADSVLLGLEGTALLDDRNARVVEILQEQIGQGHRKIAILYGAGHMGQLEASLRRQGFERASQSWLDAWDLREPPQAKRNPSR